MKRKIINLLGWGFVLLTTISIICTMLTTYGLIPIPYFNNYAIFQWCMFCTMLMWSIRMFAIRKDTQNKLDPIIYMFFAVGSVFFLFLM